MRYVGIDIGKWKCRAAMMDPEGKVFREAGLGRRKEVIIDSKLS